MRTNAEDPTGDRRKRHRHTPDADAVDVGERIRDVSGEWEELADAVGATPFERPGWVEAWWEAFGKGRLQIVTLRRAGTLVAVAPLRLRWGALTSPTNWHTPLSGLLARDPVSAAAAAHALFAGRTRQISLSFVDPEGAAACAFREAATRAGYRSTERPVLRSPYVAIDGDWSRYERRLTSKRRSNLRRLHRRLEQRGELTFELSDGTDRLETLLDEGFRVEASGWKATRGTAIASRPDTHHFYRRLAHWAAARGSLRLAFMRLDGRALAFDYCLEEGGVHYLLKTGYDEAYRPFAPGVLLRRQMLARAFSIGLHTYEFLGTDDVWKHEWTDSYHERKLVQAFAPSVAGAAERAAFVYGRPLAKRALTVVRR